MSDLTAAGGRRPLFAATARSTTARGPILGIALPTLPPGYLSADASAIPGVNRLACGDLSMPFLAAGRVSYPGEPVVLIAGPDRDQAAELAQQVSVSCAANEDDADAAPFREIGFERGDAEAALARSARVVEGTYRTGYQEAVSPFSLSVFAVREDREMIVACPTPDPFALRDNIAALLGTAQARVRVRAVPDYGAVAGRLPYPDLMAGHAALLAELTCEPVRLLYTHKESLAHTPKRPPCTARYRSGIAEDGSLTAMDVELDFDVGAWPLFSADILEHALIAACGGYRCDDVRVKARLNPSPRPPSAAFMGWGEPQVFFGLELHVARIAAELGTTPWEWRQRHLENATVFPSGMRRGREDPVELLHDVLARSDFRRKWAAYEAARKRRGAAPTGGPSPLTVVGRAPLAPATGYGPLRGIGLALAFHGLGPLTGADPNLRSTIRIVLDRGTRLRIYSSQTADAAAAAWVDIAAATLGIAREHVILEPADTAEAPDSGPAAGSRVATALSELVGQACRAIEGLKAKSMPPIQVTRSLRRSAGPIWSAGSPRGLAYHGLLWEATVVEMEIDPITFQATCRGVWTTLAGDADTPSEKALISVEENVLYNLDSLLLDKGSYRDGVWSESAPGENPGLGILDAPEVHLALINRARTGLADVPIAGAAPAAAVAMAQAIGRAVASAPCTAADLAGEPA